MAEEIASKSLRGSVAPKEGEFQEGKGWFSRKGSILTLGLTPTGIEEIGTVEKVELPEEGDDFEKGNVVVTLDGSNGKLELITPATGMVQELNEALSDEPEIVTEDPLEEGWLVKLEIEDSSDLKEFD
jgi:glycine cleavage system H protein